MSTRIDTPRTTTVPRDTAPLTGKPTPPLAVAKPSSRSPVDAPTIADAFERSNLSRLMNEKFGFTAPQPLDTGSGTSTATGSPAPTTAAPTPLARNDKQKEASPEVKTLQQNVNAWRATQGKPPLKDDGFFGPKTEAAVKEFQKANGLPPTGKASVGTQSRLDLENNANFKGLNDSVKTKVRSQMTGAGDNVAQLENIQNLATGEGFGSLSATHQTQMLNALAAHPADTDLTSSLSSLAKDATFRDLHDDTKTLALGQLEKSAGNKTALDNVVSLSTAPDFNHLSTGHQKQMLNALGAKPNDTALAKGLRQLAGSTAFQKTSDATKTGVVDALTTSGTVDKPKVDAALALVGSPAFAALAEGDKALVTEGLKGAKADPNYSAAVSTLVANPKFQSLGTAEKTAVLSQVKNYPDARSVSNIDRLVGKDWFTKQDLGDKQRSLQTVGYLSQHSTGDRATIDNTLEKFLGPKADFKLEWKTYTGAQSNFYGEGGDKTLSLNRAFIPAGDAKMVPNSQNEHLALHTVAHEVSHLIQNDKVDKTFKYFEAEYRAWYVGFKAEHGRVPTNQEAFDQRISWQLNPNSFYGKYADKALKDPKEAKAFYDYMSKMSGQTVNASNFKTVIGSDSSKWPTASQPAPVPSGSLDNH